MDKEKLTILIRTLAQAFNDFLVEIEGPAAPAPETPPTPRPLKRAESSKNRREALLAGISMYMGGPCPQGHSGLRYATSATCVGCKRNEMCDLRGGRKKPLPPLPTMHQAYVQKENRERRMLALGSAGEKFYDAVEPCVFGHVKRYVSNNACVECAHKKRKDRS